MTENKQFKLKIIGDINDVDSEIILKEGGQPLCEFISIEDARLVRDLLNAFHEENNQLRKDREDLFYRERDTKNDWRKLKYENEQLKSELKALRKKYNDFSDRVEQRLKQMDKGLVK